MITDVSLTVSSGERACLIGENGTGKTTPLRIIAGLDDDHAGRIDVPGTIGLYHQQPAFDLTLTVGEVLAEATAPQRRLAAEVARLVEGLGLADIPRDRPAGELSGGQQSRPSLAWLLLRRPDTLLLDEPTNHFSLLLATQLEASVRDYPGAVVVASHDRWLRAGWRGDRLRLDPLG